MIYRLLLILVLFSSCKTPLERLRYKEEKSKIKLKKILNEYPNLVKETDTVKVVFDTFTVNKTIVYYDTIQTRREILDSSLYLELDSTYRIQQGNIEALFALNKNRKLKYKIIKQPEFIYKVDTIYSTDTLIKENVVVTKFKEINTKPSIFWNIWFYVKKWLWLILLIIFGLITFYYIKKINKI